MHIEYDKPGNPEFYKEAVNVLLQYKRLLKDPDRKLKDMFKQFRTQTILCAVLLVVIVLELVLWGKDVLLEVFVVLMLLAGFINWYYLKQAKDLVKNMGKPGRTVFTVDEEGIEISKEGEQQIRMAWEKIAFVRAFEHTVSFLPKDVPGFVFSVESKDKQQIFDYMKELGKGGMWR